MKDRGLVFHAKHAYMPNTLGYCGPDDRGRILRLLEDGKAGEGLLNTLRGFEAAYPFLKLIARNTGREVFDYSVPEAYWIGNSLLDRVPSSDFYDFSHRELQGKDPEKVKMVFKALEGSSPPHHSFYVLTTYVGETAAGGPNPSNERAAKLGQLIDSCRISWAKVKEVGEEELRVEYRPMVIDEGRVAFAPPKVKRVRYNPEVHPFESVRAGDMVSVHWDYACDVLSPRQAKNISRYTARDVDVVNRFLASKAARRD